MRITAAVARAPHAPLSLEPLDLDPPRAGEILVRLAATGICRTDIAMRDGKRPVPQPVVLGHEGAGTVEAVGQGVQGLSPGDRVVLSYDFCGACPPCETGHPAFCDQSIALNFGGARPDGTTPLRCEGMPIHGHFFGQSSFATHAISPARNAVRIEGETPFHLLAPLGCGLQTGAGAIFNSLALRPGQSLVVAGSGAVGLAAVMAARLSGASAILATDPNPARRALALELGATHALDPAETPLHDALRAILPRGPDLAFDTTGQPTVLRDLFRALAPLGTLGTCAIGGPEIPLPLPELMNTGKRILGIVQGDATSRRLIPTLAELHRQGRFPIGRLVQTYPFADINTALADLDAGRTIKPVLVFPG